ncbi:hypothetical protein GGTG_03521 [Gaeumannomyces tritici R3-111a-1]|uniref:GH16 domain-containing protein n=1 Tax=Gaeumannomyces tritici (strain R3-111a-1) TaxID=644352 RepID=J3NQG4_GAET3|nr:hypothetical protein GGTG_03521 [Gaeumannomyces tritici R3-111a-1]EJT78420.1 hypothetical protein GGTG_03521 [Gaeumannomyces tritici R3-111a-1]
MLPLGAAALLLLSPRRAAAWAAPAYSDLRLVWQDVFAGPGGSAPNAGSWNTITNINVNGEWQRYTTDSRNLQISGGGTVQIVPWRNGQTGEWTSGRIESKYTFTPQPGAVTVAEAQVRFGTNDVGRKKGLWPAFWLLGDAIRRGTPWPQCGELDILETVNGALTGYGTVHCDVYPGGRCNEPNGVGGTVGIPDQGWHTWRIQWDRRPGDWRSETISWFIDGRQFFSINGERIGDAAVWQSLCHQPLYFILNMAVGGTFPGPPNGDTLDGYGSMLEVAYVAHFIST